MSEGKIYAAISAVMKDCGFVAKDSRNPQQNYKYRGIDAVMNALNPALIKNKVFVVPEMLEQTREERHTSKGGLLIYSICRMKYTFYTEDGSCVSAVVTGEGMDSGDKATNKAMSAAFKYACFQTFCIPTEEMYDSEMDSPEPVQKTSNTGGKASQKTSGASGKAAESSKKQELSGDLQRYIHDIVNKYQEHKLMEQIRKKFGVNNVSEMTKEQGEKCAAMLNAFDSAHTTPVEGEETELK